jgi:hypothetical protein
MEHGAECQREDRRGKPAVISYRLSGSSQSLAVIGYLLTINWAEARNQKSEVRKSKTSKSRSSPNGAAGKQATPLRSRLRSHGLVARVVNLLKAEDFVLAFYDMIIGQ